MAAEEHVGRFEPRPLPLVVEIRRQVHVHRHRHLQQFLRHAQERLSERMAGHDGQIGLDRPLDVPLHRILDPRLGIPGVPCHPAFRVDEDHRLRGLLGRHHSSPVESTTLQGRPDGVAACRPSPPACTVEDCHRGPPARWRCCTLPRPPRSPSMTHDAKRCTRAENGRPARSSPAGSFPPLQTATYSLLPPPRDSRQIGPWARPPEYAGGVWTKTLQLPCEYLDRETEVPKCRKCHRNSSCRSSTYRQGPGAARGVSRAGPLGAGAANRRRQTVSPTGVANRCR